MVIVSIVGVRIVYTTLIYRQTNRRNSVGGQIESDKDALAQEIFRSDKHRHWQSRHTKHKNTHININTTIYNRQADKWQNICKPKKFGRGNTNSHIHTHTRLCLKSNVTKFVRNFYFQFWCIKSFNLSFSMIS